MESLKKHIKALIPLDKTFKNWPIKKTLKDYKIAQEEFIKYYSKLKGVIAIYQFGSVTVPGLSDLDFFVILDDNYKHKIGTLYGIGQFSRKTQYVLLHPQSFISESIAYNLHKIYPVFDLKLVYGSKIKIIDSGNSKKEIFLPHLLDNFIQVVPRFFWQDILSSCSDMRNIIAKLNLLKYYKKMALDINYSGVKRLSLLADKICELRDEYFNLDNSVISEKILELGIEAIIIMTDFVFYYAKYLEANNFVQYETNQKLFGKYNRTGYETDFCSTSNYCESIEKTIKAFKEKGEIRLFFPFVMGCVFSNYKKQNGIIGQFINSYFTGYAPKLKKSVNKFYVDKINLLERQVLIFSNNNIPVPFFQCYGFSFNIVRKPLDLFVLFLVRIINKIFYYLNKVRD